jgi:hypothetical protein
VENLIKGDVTRCSDEGKLKTSRACPKFKTDPSAIREVMENDEGGVFQEIAAMSRGMQPRHLRAIAGAMLNEITTRKFGFYMWQPVYIRYRGTASSNYMSNFMTARILNADKETVRIVSDNGAVVMRYPNSGNLGPSIYTVADFEGIKQEMIDKGKVKDPIIDRPTSKSLRAIGLEDIDLQQNAESKRGGITSIEKVSGSNRLGRRTKNTGEIFDLTQIARAIDSGTQYANHSEETGEVSLRPNNYRSGGRNRTREFEAGDL